MELITKTDYDLTHSSEGIGEEEFDRLSELARDLTSVLCFGREAWNESAARRAMKEMISYWISRGGYRAVSGQASPKQESIGNYSVTNREETVPTVHGVSISPSALLILDSAGLRDHRA